MPAPSSRCSASPARRAGAMLGAAARLAAASRSRGATLIRLPDAAGADALPGRRAGGQRGRRRRRAGDDARHLALARGARAASSRSRPPRSIASCRRWSTSSSSAASTSRRAAIPGQEIVARSQYRGTIKRRTFLFDCDTRPQPARTCSAAPDSGEAGRHRRQRRAASGEPGGALSIQLRLAASRQRRAAPRLLGRARTLGRRELPYALPSDAASTH